MRCGDFGGVTAKGKDCTRRAGWGRDASTGRCKYHHQEGRRRPEGEDSPPGPPTGLSDQARRTWWAVLNDWVLSAEELLILEGGLRAWDLYRRAERKLSEEGPVTVSESGTPKRNPLALVARDAFAQYRDSVRQLALESEVLPEG